MKHLKSLIVFCTLSSSLAFANDAAGSDCGIIWAEFESYMSAKDFLSAANEVDNFRMDGCLAKDDLEKKRAISQLRVEEYLQPIEEISGIVSASFVPGGRYNHTTTECLIYDYRRDTNDLKDILNSTEDDGLFEDLNTADKQGFLSRIDAALVIFNQVIQDIETERKNKYYKDVCAPLMNTKDSQSSTLTTERDTYKAERDSCLADKTTCEVDKTTCNTEKTTCEADKTTCNTEKTTCETDKTTCNTDKATCETDKTTCNTDKATCEAEIEKVRDEKTICETSYSNEALNCQNTKASYKKSLSDLAQHYKLSKSIEAIKNDLSDSQSINTLAAKQCTDLGFMGASNKPDLTCVTKARTLVRTRLEKELKNLETLRTEFQSTLKDIGLHTDDEVNSI